MRIGARRDGAVVLAARRFRLVSPSGSGSPSGSTDRGFRFWMVLRTPRGLAAESRGGASSFGLALLLLAGGGLSLAYIRRRAGAQAPAEAALSPEEEARLQAILKE